MMDTNQTLDALSQRVAFLSKTLADWDIRDAEVISRQEHYAAFVNLFQMIDASIPEIINFALGQGVKLTQSYAACLYFVNAPSGISDRYFMDASGGAEAGMFPFPDLHVLKILADDRKPKIINLKPTEFESHPGSSTIDVETSCLLIPVFGRDRVEAIGILCGKATRYESSDISLFNLIMDSVLRLVNNKRTADVLITSIEQNRQHQAERTALFEAGRYLLGNDDLRGSAALARSEEKIRRLSDQSKYLRENYESLLKATQDGVLIYEMSKGVTYINPAFGRIFGYSLDEVQRLTIPSVLDIESPLDNNHWLMTDYPERKPNFKTKGRTKDGKVVDLDINVSSFVRPSADVTGILFIIRDLTQIEMLRNQLYQAQKQEALGVLAGGIAHDFNNILSAIVGYTELTLNYISKEDRCFNHLQQVLKASQRAGDLAQQILAFSRQTENEYRPTNILPILKETIKFLRASLPSTIEIVEKIDFQDDMVMAAPTQIHQVMMNLCTNARQAMRNGGLLTLTLCNTSIPDEKVSPKPISAPPGRYLKLTVQDSGTGIPANIMERIFEPYFTTKLKGEGSGLGLAMVQSIVETHNGAVTVTSKPGFGASFTVYLPLTEKKPPVENPDPEFLPKGDEKILVVDDEIQLTRLCNYYLKQFGYEITMANSSVEALDLFKQNPDQFDMLLTDLTMSKMTGVELIQACHAIKPGLPVVICSGYSEEMSEISASEKFGAIFLHKPFDLSALAKSIRMALDQKWA